MSMNSNNVGGHNRFKFHMGSNCLDFSDEINGGCIIQIHKPTLILSDDIVQSTGLVMALYLKSAYL